MSNSSLNFQLQIDFIPINSVDLCQSRSSIHDMNSECKETPPPKNTCTSPPEVKKKTDLPSWKTSTEGTAAEDSLCSSPSPKAKRRLDMDDVEMTKLRKKVEVFRKLVKTYDDTIAEIKLLEEEDAQKEK